MHHDGHPPYRVDSLNNKLRVFVAAVLDHSAHLPNICVGMTSPDAKRIIKATWRAIALVPLLSSAFMPQLQLVPSRHIRGKIHFPACRLSSSQKQGNQADSSAEDLINSNKTIARAGGRRPRTTKSKSKNPDGNGFFVAIRQLAIPLLALSIIMRFLFGGGSNDPNMVYYSRSVYQSTTYTRDGNVETTRRENFQSNIPELVKQSQKKYNNDEGIESRGLFDIIDKEMDDEMDSLLYQKW